MTEGVAIGLDIGTSGARAVALDGTGRVVAYARVDFESLSHRRRPGVLIDAVDHVLRDIAGSVALPSAVIAVAGTSGSLVPMNAMDQPCGEISLYLDSCMNSRAIADLAGSAPHDAPVHGATSAVARAAALIARGAAKLAFEPDFIGAYLAGHRVNADVNSALKTGADPDRAVWPDWLPACGVPLSALPGLCTPGALLAGITPERALALGLPQDTQIVAGTTDGCAAALAAGLRQPGDAVTSLGSTLVIKMMIDQPVTDPTRGICSHRIAGSWLVGGGSNAGGAVLRHFFDEAQMQAMAPRVDPDQPTGLAYVPLLDVGDRFPVMDPQMMPRFLPRPSDDAVFYQGILESLVALEIRAYRALKDLCGIAPGRIFTVGGGTLNAAWMAMRHAHLPAPIRPAQNAEAAYGAALLARMHLTGDS